ncbi:MAG: hypothetical protein ABL866_14220 [Devosia sp.]
MQRETLTVGQVARGADLNVNTLRSWFMRGHLSLGVGDLVSPGSTIARGLGRVTVLAICIFGRLIEAGVRPDIAELLTTYAVRIASSDSRRELFIHHIDIDASPNVFVTGGFVDAADLSRIVASARVSVVVPFAAIERAVADMFRMEDANAA